MWEGSGFKECASDNVLVASDGSGGSRETPKSVRQIASGVATPPLQPLSDTSFKLPRTGFLGGQVPGRQTVPRAELFSRVEEKSNIQIPIGCKYVTNGIMHRVRFGTRTNWGLVVNPFPADRRAQWGHGLYQSQGTHGRTWGPPVIARKQDRLLAHACRLFG